MAAAANYSDKVFSDDDESNGENEAFSPPSPAASQASDAGELPPTPPPTPASVPGEVPPTPCTLRSRPALCIGMLSCIKAMIVGLLASVIRKHQQKNCYGCEVDHPSQRQHPCLFPAGRNYFYIHFDSVLSDLWTSRLTPALIHVLTTLGIRASIGRLEGAVEAILYDLREARDGMLEITRLEQDLFEQTPALKQILEEEFLSRWEAQD